MAYEYDMFLSYSRKGEWPDWVREKLLPLLRHWLGEELGREANVFFDQELEAGQAWPHRLRMAVVRSRVVVPLWSRMYFSSDWCLREMSMMVARERHLGFGSAANPGRLVVPAAIHDGDDFPPATVANDDGNQFFPLQDVANVRIGNGTVLHEQFSDRIRDWAPSIRSAISRAPDFDAAWRYLDCEEIMNEFRQPPPAQTTQPVF
jgi:hypothetical protein